MYFERTLKSCFMDQCGVLLFPHSSGRYSILTSGALKMLKALKTVFLRLHFFFLNKSIRETGGTLEVVKQTVCYSLRKKNAITSWTSTEEKRGGIIRGSFTKKTKVYNQPQKQKGQICSWMTLNVIFTIVNFIICRMRSHPSQNI